VWRRRTIDSEGREEKILDTEEREGREGRQCVSAYGRKVIEESRRKEKVLCLERGKVDVSVWKEKRKKKDFG
jgi:hypothetical protein